MRLKWSLYNKTFFLTLLPAIFFQFPMDYTARKSKQTTVTKT